MRNEIQNRIDRCISVLEESTGWSLWGNTRDKFNELIDEVAAIEIRLSRSETDEQLIEVKRDIVKLEIRAVTFRTYRMFLPYVFYTYLGFVAIFAIFSYVDIPSFINTTLGVEAPEKLISFGVAGALVYLSTFVLSISTGKGPLGPVTNFAFRLLLAIVVPIILVALFFSTEGEITEFKITPELLSFVVGYSATLVIEIMNKAVEKVSTMVKSL